MRNQRQFEVAEFSFFKSEWLQVKKLEDRAGQLGREKEELSQALIALKKGQSIAAGPGQTRMVNLMRRVHTLVRRKPYVLDNTQLVLDMYALEAVQLCRGCRHSTSKKPQLRWNVSSS